MRAKQDRVGDRERDARHGAPDPRRRRLRRRRRRAGDAQPEPAARATRPAARSTSSSTTRSASRRRPEEARSSAYATDVAKMLQIPIFHVNGEDPEAVAQVVRLALDFRASSSATWSSTCTATAAAATTKATSRRSRSRCCTRRSSSAKPVREGYLEHLLAARRRHRARKPTEIADEPRRAARAGARRGARASDYVPRAEKPTRHLERATAAARTRTCPTSTTGVDARAARRAARGADRSCPTTSTRIPRSSSVLETAPRDGRGQAAARLGRGRGARVRDARRRGHARPADAARTPRAARSASATPCCTTSRTGARYMPLQHLAPDQAPVEIYNSPLSEAGVLGFEYGYSLDCPGRAGALGGAVRRLRERGPGDRRPVHRQRRGQVAPAQRARAAPAAWLRRPGAGALQRPARAVPRRWPPRTTSRSSTRPRRPSTSTACAGRCCGRGASRWS